MGTEPLKRALLLTEQYYPLQVPATSRVHSFAKYLPQLGYECQAIAPAWNDDNLQYVAHARKTFPGSETLSPCPVHYVPVHPVIWSSGFKNYLKPFAEGPEIGEEMVRAGTDLWRKKPFDVVLATAPAYYPLRAAIDLGKRFSVPVVADLRDVYGEYDGGLPLTWSEWFRSSAKNWLGMKRRCWRELARMCNACGLYDYRFSTAGGFVDADWCAENRGPCSMDLIPTPMCRRCLLPKTSFECCMPGRFTPFNVPSRFWTLWMSCWKKDSFKKTILRRYSTLEKGR